jgi:outer membrane protein OmpA-like peptidoglycan-associated protein
MEEVHMEQGLSVRKTVATAMMALGLVALTTGCATKKYVRTTVDTRAQELSARLDNADNTLKATQTSVEELNGVTREHGQKIATLDTTLKQTDQKFEQKTQQAMQVGEAAQQSATKVGTQVTALETKFQNRNHYVSLKEEQVLFKLNSAKLEDDGKAVLDQLAQQLKDNPDVILVMEGRTDASGSPDYNVQLGEKRVQAVIRYLIVDQGVPMHRVSEISFGEDKPLADNKTREGRAQNRSVVVRVMGPEQTGGQGMVSQTRPEMENQDNR